MIFGTFHSWLHPSSCLESVFAFGGKFEHGQRFFPSRKYRYLTPPPTIFFLAFVIFELFIADMSRLTKYISSFASFVFPLKGRIWQIFALERMAPRVQIRQETFSQ